MSAVDELWRGELSTEVADLQSAMRDALASQGVIVCTRCGTKYNAGLSTCTPCPNCGNRECGDG